MTLTEDLIAEADRVHRELFAGQDEMSMRDVFVVLLGVPLDDVDHLLELESRRIEAGLPVRPSKQQIYHHTAAAILQLGIAAERCAAARRSELEPNHAA
jgi:hypothetical protein